MIEIILLSLLGIAGIAWGIDEANDDDGGGGSSGSTGPDFTGTNAAEDFVGTDGDDFAVMNGGDDTVDLCTRAVLGSTTVRVT